MTPGFISHPYPPPTPAAPAHCTPQMLPTPLPPPTLLFSLLPPEICMCCSLCQNPFPLTLCGLFPVTHKDPAQMSPQKPSMTPLFPLLHLGSTPDLPPMWPLSHGGGGGVIVCPQQYSVNSRKRGTTASPFLGHCLMNISGHFPLGWPLIKGSGRI